MPGETTSVAMVALYGIIFRNMAFRNPAEAAELRRRAEREFLPHLRQAPGFRDYYAIRDDSSGVMHIIAIWESPAHAEAFRATAEAQAWTQTAQELGAQNEAAYRGEVEGHVSTRT